MASFKRITRAVKAVPEGERALRPYLFGIAAVGITSVTVFLIGSELSVADATMLHLLPILIIAVRFGIWPSIVTSVVAATSCNFFFSRPYFGFGFEDFPDVFTLAAFMITATTVNYWAGEAHRHGDTLRRRQTETEILYRINGRLLGQDDAPEIIQAVHAELPETEKVALALYLAHDSVLELAATLGNTWAGSAEESRAAEAVLRGKQPAGNGTGRVGEAILRYLPITADGTVLGVLGITPKPGSEEFHRALATEIGEAIGRTRRIEDRARAAVMAEVARLQSVLVTSISHDFRNPLATIIGAASSLLDDAVTFPPVARRELLKSIQDSGERLHRYVTNLLNTGRIEAGALKLNRGLVEIGDLLATAISHLSPTDVIRPIDLSIAGNLRLLYLDPVLIEQVLLNLLENAVKYSLPDSRVCVRVYEREDCIAVEVTNVTASPPTDLGRIFDRFYRSEGRASDGSGLGLSICKGFVEAHGGTITASADGCEFRIVVEFTADAETPIINTDMSDG